MLGAVRTPKGIPRSESLTHQGWPRNGYWAASAPVERTIWILTARGEYGESQSVTGLFLSNENTIGPAVDLLALVLREASRDR